MAAKINQSEPIYSPEEVLRSCLQYFDGDELGATTWINKYAMRNQQGDLLEQSPTDMHHRMAKQFARIEKAYDQKKCLNGNAFERSVYGQQRADLEEDKIYELFKGFKKVIPQGSVMYGLGNNHVLSSLSNCVVMPEIHDSYGGVFQTDQQLAQLFKRRCGVGVDLSTLRPKGAPVANAAGTTSGAASFMERFSNTTREVAQNGRRGALMLTMDIAHPDVESFILAKQDLTKVTGANVSVRLSDEFMQAVENNSSYIQQWPIDAKDPKIKKTISARNLWNTLVACAHNTAEPGIIFWDRQHWYSTSSVYPEYRNVSTNPCSEIAMQGGDSCRLIAINLMGFVEHPNTPQARFDFENFYEVTYESQRLMDDLVDLELETVMKIIEKIQTDPAPVEVKQAELDTWKLLHSAGEKGRRTGLGITALADVVAALGLRLGSDDSLVFIEAMAKEKCRAEFDSSVDLAIERGKFEGFDPEIENTSEFVEMLGTTFPEIYARMMKHGRRNISISTVAPTGTISMLAKTSSGVEPVFMTSYKRRRKTNINSFKNATATFVDEMGDHWEEFTVFHDNLEKWMKANPDKKESESPYAGATAEDLNWKKRIEIQAILQKYVTHSISSTINLPSETNVQRVNEIYFQAWKQGLKGLTVYRDGSRNGVIVANELEDEKSAFNAILTFRAPVRPDQLLAKIVRFRNNDEQWIAVVGLLEGAPYEIFTGKAEDSFLLPKWVEEGWILKTRKSPEGSRYDFQYIDQQESRVTVEGLSRSFNKEYWNYAKLISGILRQGMPLHNVVDVINGLNLHDDSINTWKAGVARTLKLFIPNGTVATDKTCSECKDPKGLIYEEGCLHCKSCGHSKCG